MSTQTEAMKLALEALDVLLTEPIAHKAADRAEYLLLQAAPAIRKALAEEPAQQEPMAWMTKTGSVWKTKEDETDQPLYTSPPAQRTWVGLTHEEFRDFASTLEYGTGGLIRAIEAKLREKNT